ncbi:hypothetical protein AMTRI_Chr09g15520 [Amborella trichopoda]
MKLLLSFSFLILISTGEMASIVEAKECSKDILAVPIFCIGALCRYTCRSYRDQGHGKCHGPFKCRCTWPCNT